MILDLFTDYTLRTVALGVIALGITSGALGTFAVLRRQSLLGDAISHAALPGVALAFLLTGSKAPLVLVVGAALAGWIATLLITSIVRLSRIKYDTALGLILSVFFGVGLVLLTFVQRSGSASQAGLDQFLFGQAAALVEQDVVTMAVLGGLALLVMLLFWKEFKLVSFDADFGQSLGLGMRMVDVLLTSLLVVAIVIGLQTVGVVLMSAILVAPAAAARQWSNHLGRVVAIAGGFGALAGLAGALVSSRAAHIPTGPTIVLAAGLIVGMSLVFAPNRGLAWRSVRRWQNRQKLQVRIVLANLYALSQHHQNPHHPHPIATIVSASADQASVPFNLRVLADLGWVRETAPGTWALTEEGLTEARTELTPQNSY
ncbi:MAG: metal ABC transporter permease [Bacteroidota bacterium]